MPRRMPFLPPNQQRQSTEGIFVLDDRKLIQQTGQKPKHNNVLL